MNNSKKRERIANTLLKKKGWSPDGGLLKGEGYYQFVGNIIVYVTDEDGEHPEAGRDVYIGFYTEEGDPSEDLSGMYMRFRDFISTSATALVAAASVVEQDD